MLQQITIAITSLMCGMATGCGVTLLIMEAVNIRIRKQITPASSLPPAKEEKEAKP